MIQWSTYRGDLEIHGTLRVQDVVEETAVVVVTGELGLEGRLVFQRGSGGSQLCLKVLSLRATERCRPVQIAHSILEVDLLTVVVDQSLLLNIGLIVQVWACIHAVVVGHCGRKGLVEERRRGRGDFFLAPREDGKGGGKGDGDGSGGFTSVGSLCDLPKKLNFEGFRFGVVLILSAHKVSADSSYAEM